MAVVEQHRSDYESSTSTPLGMRLTVKHTFIDCEGTVSDLLTAEERHYLLVCHAKTACESSRSFDDDDMSESSASADCVIDVQGMPSLDGKASILRCPSSSSLASTCASPTSSAPRRARFSTEDSVDSAWDDLLSADSEICWADHTEEAPVEQMPARAERGQWSIGAEGHEAQECKPCAFLDSRKGCLQGSACKYCHLCEPGEKRRRMKAKRALMRNSGS